MPKLNPLQEWICDSCGKITDTKNGWVEWIGAKEGRHSFHIVHNADKCFHHTNSLNRRDMHLREFLGVEGLQYFLSMLDVGPIIDPGNEHPQKPPEMRSFIDTVRRLQIPYYEEARRYFSDEFLHGEFGGVNEKAIFMPRYCKAIIERYESTESSDDE